MVVRNKRGRNEWKSAGYAERNGVFQARVESTPAVGFDGRRLKKEKRRDETKQGGCSQAAGSGRVPALARDLDGQAETRATTL